MPFILHWMLQKSNNITASWPHVTEATYKFALAELKRKMKVAFSINEQGQ